MSSPALALTLCDLYDFVSFTEVLGAPFQRLRLPEPPDGLARRARVLTDRLHQVAQSTAGEVALRARQAATELGALASALEAAAPSKAELRARWRALAATYEVLLREAHEANLAAPAGRALARLKPRNLARNLFHAANGVVGVALYEILGQRLVVAALAATIFFLFIAMDLGRRLSPAFNEKLVERVFGAISRPHEHLHVPSAVWYVGALLVGVVWLPKAAIEVGVIVLALGDPAASLVGKRLGRRRLLGQKTLEGSLAFLGVGAVSALAVLLLFSPEVGGLAALRVAFGAALAGAVAEVGTVHLDDNLTVPLLASTVAALLL